MRFFQEIYNLHNIDRADLNKCLILMHVHIIPSMVFLIKELLSIGIEKEQIIVIGKPYSTIQSSLKELKEIGIEASSLDFCTNFLEYDEHVSASILKILRDLEPVFEKYKKMILCDSGGNLKKSFSQLPIENDVCSIELTTQGTFFKPYLFPTIEMALCHVKKNIESKIIAQSIMKSLSIYDWFTDIKKIGVLGYGSIGKSIAEIVSNSHGIHVYDPKIENVPKEFQSTYETIMDQCELIIGCTGQDAFKSDTKLASKKNQYFVSASSKNIEFLSLLKIQKLDPSKNIHILNNGFPINFNRENEVENFEDILLTRGLLFAGILQAINSNETRNVAISLDQMIEKKILEFWRMQKEKLIEI